MELFDLTGRKALVTGGSRGLGRGMAEGLLKAGADVAIVSSSDTIFSAAEALGQAAGRPVHPVQADLSDRAQLRRAFDQSLEKLGGAGHPLCQSWHSTALPGRRFPGRGVGRGSGSQPDFDVSA